MFIELNEREQHQVYACIALQAMKYDEQAEKLEKKENLTQEDVERLCKLQSTAKYYWALGSKINGDSSILDALKQKHGLK